MEIELAWRQEEIAFFKNQLNYVTEDKKGKYRKSLVLILYSHFEGYTKICLQTYIQYINSQNLDRRDVNFGLMVAGMNKEFLAYENLDRKCDIFRKELPEDAKLHRLFRRVDFMEELDNFMNQKLHIQDSLIDTESNLWYNNFAMLGNGLKWSFPNICVTNLLLVEWKFIISTRE